MRKIGEFVKEYTISPIQYDIPTEPFWETRSLGQREFMKFFHSLPIDLKSTTDTFYPINKSIRPTLLGKYSFRRKVAV